MAVLSASYYQQEDVVFLAKDLLGKVLVTETDGCLTSGMITETEAYRAPDDKACHAYQNRRTRRTETMFAPGGTAYIYLCYGIHHLFNVVTGPAEKAMAVLIRAIEPIDGKEHMLERRSPVGMRPQLTAGPGVMSKALGLTTNLDGACLYDRQSGIHLEDRGIIIPEKEIIAGPRIGVAYAEECAEWPWRFRISGNRWVSK